MYQTLKKKIIKEKKIDLENKRKEKKNNKK